jgi:stringent starvation protein B
MDISLPASAKPQLLRAAHEWCTENGYAPYLLVMVDATVAVPKEFVKDGQIVLNTSYEATGDLTMTNDWVRFKARFGGKPRDIQVPMNRVAALFARETGQGIVFDLDLASPPEPPAVALGEQGNLGAPSVPSEPPANPSPKPFLTRIK